MAKKLTAYERACRDLPKESDAKIEAEDAIEAGYGKSPVWELAWAVLHELDLRQDGEDGWDHVDPEVWRDWLTKHAPTSKDFPQGWRRN